MTEITVQLDNEALRDATAQAILGTLTPEIRDKILQNAVQALLNKRGGTYGSGKSQLEEAFDAAVRVVAHQEAQRIVSEDAQIKERIAKLLRDTADKVLSADLEKMSDRMAEAFIVSMRKDY